MVMVTVIMEKRNSVLDLLAFCFFLCIKIGQKAVNCVFSKPNAAFQAQPKRGKFDAEWKELPSGNNRERVACQCLCDPMVKTIRFNTPCHELFFPLSFLSVFCSEDREIKLNITW